MPDGNDMQTRAVLTQVADAAAIAAVEQLVKLHPDLSKPKPELPPPLKWAGGIFAAVMTTGAVALVVWLVSSVNTMQLTLARVDERMINKDSAQETRFAAVEARVSKLEEQKKSPGDH